MSEKSGSGTSCSPNSDNDIDLAFGNGPPAMELAGCCIPSLYFAGNSRANLKDKYKI